MKSTKIQCNRVIPEAKKSLTGLNSVKAKYQNLKTCIKYGGKVKEMKNGYKVQAYPIKFENNDFSSRQDKAEAFVNMFCRK